MIRIYSKVISGYDMNNVYVIRDSMDQQIFYAAEGNINLLSVNYIHSKIKKSIVLRNRILYEVKKCLTLKSVTHQINSILFLRYWCGSQRKFEIHVLDNSKKEVFQFSCLEFNSWLIDIYQYR